MTTYSTKAKDIKRQWHLVDAKGQILGRMSTRIADLLIGKSKSYYSTHLDCGDWVVVINAQNVRVTGKKKKQKIYYRHSGYPGGLKAFTFEQIIQKDPRKIIEHAVRGMLPKNKLRKKRMGRLKVFVSKEHPYEKKFKN
jgi:large subunit ribosomal protein L13